MKNQFNWGVIGVALMVVLAKAQTAWALAYAYYCPSSDVWYEDWLLWLFGC